MDPNVENMTLSAAFNVAMNCCGYIDKAASYATHAETNRPGVLVARAARGPETLGDSIAQGQAAAMAALHLMRAPKLQAVE
jgi:heterodisulfide reductase subunit A2